MIIHGDCLEELKKLKENSVDTIITDPPYGLEFMGKDWDKFATGRGKKYKKGGDMLDVSMPGTGFTKLPNYSRKVAKRCLICGKQAWSGNPCKCKNPKWEIDNSAMEAFQEFSYNWLVEALRVIKPGGTALIFGGTRTYHRVACAVEDSGFILKDCIMWLYGSGFPKATDISKQLDKGHKRKVVGKKPYTNDRGMKGNKFAGGEYERIQCDITEPATKEAKEWNGWKSHGLKPAYEPIIVAMKPNEGTYANNALKWGVSGLNIDGGRIGYKNEKDFENAKGGDSGSDKANIKFYKGIKKQSEKITDKGRFPANIILDEEAGKMLDEQSGESKSGKDQGLTQTKARSWKNTSLAGINRVGHNDKGGASRFFYCAKASKSERNKGCEGLEEKVLAQSNQAKAELKRGNEDFAKGNKHNVISKRTNHHPTVKPLKLMEYLCTLTKTPTGGVVLDPFAGSGTTGLACKNTGRDYILIEREKEYIDIIKARLGDKQTNIYDFT